jgi:hypothetical protein
MVSVIPAQEDIIQSPEFSNRRPRESGGPGQAHEISGFPLPRERQNKTPSGTNANFLTASQAGIQGASIPNGPPCSLPGASLDGRFCGGDERR